MQCRHCYALIVYRRNVNGAGTRSWRDRQGYDACRNDLGLTILANHRPLFQYEKIRSQLREVVDEADASDAN
jgi:hypothetical protein